MSSVAPSYGASAFIVSDRSSTQNANSSLLGFLPRTNRGVVNSPPSPIRSQLLFRIVEIPRACAKCSRSAIVCSAATRPATGSRTQRIMESMPQAEEAGGAGGTSSYQALKRTDLQWEKLRNAGPEPGPAPTVVRRQGGSRSPSKTLYEDAEIYDVVVCGGTLGVFIATALAQRGWRVAIVEKGQLRGRQQEWNISRKELSQLVRLGLLDAKEADDVISIEFNPSRVGFDGGTEVWVKDILNLGISPRKLIETTRERFLKAGGVIFERIGLSKLDVFDDEAVIVLDNERSIRSRLVLDAMGNASPIVRQVRWGQRPDGICLVVGSCARGFKYNSTSDIIVTTTPVVQISANAKAQSFWEAFPAGSGPNDRTTYLFTYIDATPSQPSLEELMEKYWELMPAYQDVKLEDLEFLRVLHGFFPTYRRSPLPSLFDRVLQVGDASGIQSPLSFGGFGSITRHLQRLTDGITDALDGDFLDTKSLSLLNPYMPNLSGAWLLQRAMSVPPARNPPPQFINNLLATNFKCMEKLGDPVLRPFLQDVVQFGPLAKTMGSIAVSNPVILPQIFKQVGVLPIFDWLVHFIGLGWYTFLAALVSPRLQSRVSGLSKREQFVWKRRFEAWEFGSGLDYND